MKVASTHRYAASPDVVFAKRFLEPENTVEQHDCWSAPAANGTRTGTWQVSARGVPVKVGGTLRLCPVAGGTEVEISGVEEFNDHYLARQKPAKAAKPRKKA